MSRVFIYARVSTEDQHPENQLQEIAGAGFVVDPKRIIMEHISGSVAARERPGFFKLLDRMEEGDVLVVSRLDRLGRNAIDVQQTVEALASAGVRVHCLALGGVDLTSSAGRMTMGVITAVAQFERDLLIERVHAGLARVKAQGKALGRKPSLTAAQRTQALQRLASGAATVSSLAREHNVSRTTIIRIKKTLAPAPTA
jgi:putative DNA-invertase from lambdoid prophage Rac